MNIWGWDVVFQVCSAQQVLYRFSYFCSRVYNLPKRLHILKFQSFLVTLVLTGRTGISKCATGRFIIQLWVRSSQFFHSIPPCSSLCYSLMFHMAFVHKGPTVPSIGALTAQVKGIRLSLFHQWKKMVGSYLVFMHWSQLAVVGIMPKSHVGWKRAG